MNAATAARLSEIPIPVEGGIPSRVKVTTLPDGSWTLAFCHDGGRRVEPFGTPFERVRDATEAAQRLNERAGA